MTPTTLPAFPSRTSHPKTLPWHCTQPPTIRTPVRSTKRCLELDNCTIVQETERSYVVKRRATEEEVFANLEHMSLTQFPKSKNSSPEMNYTMTVNNFERDLIPTCKGQSSNTHEQRLVLYKPQGQNVFDTAPHQLIPSQIFNYPSTLEQFVLNLSQQSSSTLERSDNLLTYSDNVDGEQPSCDQIVELPDDFPHDNQPSSSTSIIPLDVMDLD